MIDLYVCDPLKNVNCKKGSCWYRDTYGECYQTTNEEFATDEPRWKVLVRYKLKEGENG